MTIRLHQIYIIALNYLITQGVYFITDMQIWKAFFKMTNSAIFHDNEVLLNQNIRLTMCLFENK